MTDEQVVKDIKAKLKELNVILATAGKRKLTVDFHITKDDRFITFSSTPRETCVLKVEHVTKELT